ncbi:MAG: FkbM family methyltransferase [Chloroflexi bacterium]|nr:MAG: FkbM family methyltransferase [Chloroflexota bacterium]
MKMPFWLQLLRWYGRYFPISRGKGRITKWAYQHLPKLDRPIVAPITTHITTEFYPWLWADFCTLVMGSPEIYTLAIFRSLIQPNAIVFDIGAYIGAYAFTASQLATTGQVHIFEPNPQSAHRIQLAIKQNNLTNTRLNICAVSDKPGTTMLHIPQTPTESGLQPTKEPVKIVEIPVQTVDGYCQHMNITGVHLMKIDVEGAELLVLRGARKTISRYHPSMIIELHGKQSTQFGYSVTDTIRLLRDWGYTLYKPQHGLTTRPCLQRFQNMTQDRELVIARAE